MVKAVPQMLYKYIREMINRQEKIGGRAMEYYEIIVKSHIDKKRERYFEEMELIHLPEGVTLLAGNLIDQAQLHYILNKIRDMGITLISVEKKENRE